MEGLPLKQLAILKLIQPPFPFLPAGQGTDWYNLDIVYISPSEYGFPFQRCRKNLLKLSL